MGPGTRPSRPESRQVPVASSVTRIPGKSDYGRFILVINCRTTEVIRCLREFLRTERSKTVRRMAEVQGSQR